MSEREQTPWTPEEDARLREMWKAGATMTAIGAALKRPKNSIAGRRGRLGLDARPSPIPAHVPRVKKPALLPLPRTGEGMGGYRGSAAMRGDTLRALGAGAASVAVPAVVAPVAPAPVMSLRKSAPCCWPIGEPKTPEFRYCDAPGVPGRSYCAAHEAAAWVRAPKPRTEGELAGDEARRQAALARYVRGERSAWFGARG